jgi:hypothetical protein
MGIARKTKNAILKKIVERMTRDSDLVVINADDRDEVSATVETLNDPAIMDLWRVQDRSAVVKGTIHSKTVFKKDLRKNLA